MELHEEILVLLGDEGKLKELKEHQLMPKND